MSETEDTMVENPIADLNTGFLRDMLVVIDSFDERPSGQEILDVMQGNGYPDCSHGRLYPNIDRLVNKGYVKKGEIDRRTNWHALTDKGEKRLEQYAKFVYSIVDEERTNARVISEPYGARNGGVTDD